MLGADLRTIPAELRALPRWLHWKFEERKGKRTKVPYVADDPTRRASSTDSATWRPFDVALAAHQRGEVDGIGFTLGDGYVGVDLDHCVEPATSRIEGWAQKIIDLLKSYTEFSPSGTGVHVIVRGELPVGPRKKSRIEMYETGRYFTMTGNAVPGTPSTIETKTVELADLHRRTFTRSKAPNSRRATSGPGPLCDDDVIERVSASSGGEKFTALFGGNWSGYPSQSEGDLALCSLLAFEARGDYDQIDRLFRRSGLMRDKWDEVHFGGGTTYGHATIAKVMKLAPSREHDHVTPPGEEAFHQTDAGNAAAFAALHASDLRYDHRQHQWLTWLDGLRWERDRTGGVQRLVKEFVRNQYRDAASVEDPNKRKAQVNFALKCEARDRLRATEELARNEAPLSDAGDTWDGDPWLLGVDNGVVDLRTGQHRAGRPEDRLTMASPLAFDPTATCPRFERFMQEVFDGDPGLVAFVKRALGYSVCGRTTEQVLFLCYGTGANGKSTLLNIVKYVVGAYAYNLPFSAMELRQRGAIPNDIAALVGRRFVISSETNEGTRLNEARIKALTGSDPITARFLHREFFTFEPVATFWLSVNHRPVVHDDSHGFWRRIRLIPFTQRFPVDPHLGDALRAEGPGILRWLVEGCLEWQQIGLAPPSVVMAATREYQNENYALTDFIEECCDLVEGATCKASDLYAAYGKWCQAEGIEVRTDGRLSQRQFGVGLGQRFDRRHTAHGKVYDGIRLKRGLGANDPLDPKVEL